MVNAIYSFLYFWIVFFLLYNIFGVMGYHQQTESHIIKTKGDLRLFIFNLFLFFCYLSLLIAEGNESPFLNLPYLIFTHSIPFLIVIDILVYRFICTHDIPTCKQILMVLGLFLLLTGIQILCFYVYPLSFFLYGGD